MWAKRLMSCVIIAISVIAIFSAGCTEENTAENTSQYWRNQGDVLYNQSKYEEALEAYDKAIELDPDNAKAWYGKGDTLRNLDRHEEAITAYSSGAAAAAKTGNTGVSWTHKVFELIQIAFLLWISMFLVYLFLRSKDMIEEGIQLLSRYVLVICLLFVIISFIFSSVKIIALTLGLILLIYAVFLYVIKVNKRVDVEKPTFDSKKEEFFVMIFGGTLAIIIGSAVMAISSYLLYKIVLYVATFSVVQPIVPYLQPYTKELQDIILYLAKNL